MALKEIVVSDGEDDLRVDRFILKRFPSLSRKSCREFLSKHSVLIKGKKAKKSSRVCSGDRVIIDEDALNLYFTDFEPAPFSSVPVETLYGDENFIAVDKPAGIDCVPIKKSDRRTLLSAVLVVEPRLLNVSGWKRRESGLLYRLDRDVSGVVIFALDGSSFNSLVADSRKDHILKTYLAVVENAGKRKIGRGGTIASSIPLVKGKEKRVEFESLFFHPGKSLEAARRKFSKESRGRATERIHLTHIEPLLHAGALSLIKVEITRAFRHQIRSSLAGLGHPVAGDTAYGATAAQTREEIMLHCWRVSFPHPVNRKILNLESSPDRILKYDKAFQKEKGKLA